MSLSNSRASYEDCYEVMDRALDTPDGVRVGFPDKDQATYYRMRINQARSLDRKYNGQSYAPTDPRRHHSEYDTLSARIRQSGEMWWVYVEKKQRPTVIEDITEDKKIVEQPVRQVMNYRRF